MPGGKAREEKPGDSVNSSEEFTLSPVVLMMEKRLGMGEMVERLLRLRLSNALQQQPDNFVVFLHVITALALLPGRARAPAVSGGSRRSS